MQELEKILEEIERNRKQAAENGDFNVAAAHEECMNIIRKHMSGKDTDVPANDGWIPVWDERLWDILFEEACVEGEQARRIYNRLKETFGGERSEMDGKL